MGNHRDAILSDITVIIRPEYTSKLKEVVEQLNAAGVGISNLNEDVGAVEGTVEQYKLHEIQKLPFVDAVRTTFSYVADYPVGHPGDLDGPEANDDD